MPVSARYYQRIFFSIPKMKKSVLFLILGSLLISCHREAGTPVIEIEEIIEEPIIEQGDPGTADNAYGFEGDTVIKQDNIYHLFTAEVCGDPKVVKTRLAYWKSEDGWMSFYGSWRSNYPWNGKLWFGVGLVESDSLVCDSRT